MYLKRWSHAFFASCGGPSCEFLKIIVESYIQLKRFVPMSRKRIYNFFKISKRPKFAENYNLISRWRSSPVALYMGGHTQLIQDMHFPGGRTSDQHTTQKKHATTSLDTFRNSVFIIIISSSSSTLPLDIGTMLDWYYGMHRVKIKKNQVEDPPNFAARGVGKLENPQKT